MRDAPAYFRSTTLREKPQRVDRENRVITGYSAITSGEALGHELWIDEAFLAQVATAGNELGERGVKSRFTHPGLSSDGMGKLLGRSKRFRADGDRVLADLHVLEAADASPDGELGGYVMKLADEAPDMFGASIVFTRDFEAERNFERAHSEEIDTEDGETLRRFKSPDKRNKKNLRHARLKKLYACDVVDEPAANEGGFFSSAEEIAVTAERALAYVTGLSDERPEEAFGANPDRARQFVTRFLHNHGLALTPFGRKESSMGDTACAKNEAPKAATLAELKAAFPGAERAGFRESCLEKGLSLEQARQAFTELERDEARAEAAELREQIAAREKASAAAAAAGVVAPGAGRFTAVEVLQDNATAFTWERAEVKRAFGATGRKEDDENARKAFDAFQAVDLDPETGEPGRIPREMLARMEQSLKIGSEKHRRAFAMGKSTPDYAAIVAKGIVGRFYKSIGDEFAKSWAAELVWLNSESNQETETYKWLGQVPQLREWLGGRRIQGLGVNSFSITNKTWEASLGFDIEDWRFDKTGQIALRYGDLARTAVDHWESRVTDQIVADGLCYDGQNFFDTDHPAADLAEGGGSNTSTYKNELTSTEVAALNVASASAPTRDEAVDVVIGLIAYARNFRDNQNRPYNDGAKAWRIMTSANLDGAFMAAVRDRLRNSGSTNTVGEGNFRYDSKLDIDVIPNSRLTSTDVVYAFRVDSPMKPFIAQEPVPPELTFLGAGSDHAFKHNQYLGGLKAVREVDYGQWAHAIKGTLS